MDHDEELRRLQDADPARGSHPDLWQVRASVERNIATDGAADEVTWEGRTIGRLGRSTAYVAAACAAALAVGAGGYALGQSRTGDGIAPAASGSDAPEDDQEESADDPDAADSFRTSVDLGWAESGTEFGYFDDVSMTGGAVLLLPGERLSTERGGEAEVLAQRPPDFDVDAQLSAAAKRMGLSGELVGEREWRSIQQDGRSVSSYVDVSALNLSYENAYLSAGCRMMVDEMASWPAEEVPDGINPSLDPDKCLPDPTESVSKDTALTMVRQVVADFGLDPSRAQFEVYDSGGAETFGTASGTLENGWEVSVDFHVRAEGVASASIALQEDMSLGTYPVISPAEAVERANDPIFGRLSIRPGGVSEDEWYPSRQGPFREPQAIEAGTPIPISGRVTKASSAELSTGTLMDQSGGAYTVPIYLLTTVNNEKIAVVALVEEAMQLQE